MRRRFEPAGVSPRCGAGLLSPIWLFPPEASPPTDASGARQGRRIQEYRGTARGGQSEGMYRGTS